MECFCLELYVLIVTQHGFGLCLPHGRYVRVVWWTSDGSFIKNIEWKQIIEKEGKTMNNDKIKIIIFEVG